MKIFDLFLLSGDDIEKMETEKFKLVCLLNYIRLLIFTIIGYGIISFLIFVGLKYFEIPQKNA